LNGRGAFSCCTPADRIESQWVMSMPTTTVLILA
jgi:hypothetical protein